MLILLFFLFYSLFIYRLHFNPTPPPSPTRMTFPPFVPRAAQADRDCVSHSERSSSSAHLQESSFSRRVSPPGSSPSSQSSRWRLWHSITPLVPVVTKVPNRGVIGHSSLSYDSGLRLWNETLSTFDSNHVSRATGPALYADVQFGRYKLGSVPPPAAGQRCAH